MRGKGLTQTQMLECATEFLADQKMGIWIRKRGLEKDEFVIQNELDEYLTPTGSWEHRSHIWSRQVTMSLERAFKMVSLLGGLESVDRE